MKIWVFNHYALPPGESGGTRHFAMAKRMASHGHEVTIVASAFDHMSRRQRTELQGDSQMEIQDGVRFLWVRSPPYSGNTLARLWNMVRFAQLATREARTRLGPPDVIIGSSPHLFAAAAAERLARRMGIPFVLEVRDVWPASLVDLADVSPRHPLVRYLARLERRLYSRARRIVTLMPGARDHIVAHGGRADKIVWIPNGVDLNLAGSTGAPRAHGPTTFLYAGAHGQANGLGLILDAAQLLENKGLATQFKIVLMGDGPEKPGLQARVAALGLRSVEFRAPVPKKQVYDEMRAADVCLMVLKDSPVFRWGVSPNKLFDYMSSGRPTIFAVSSPFDPIRDSGGGLSVRPSATELASAMEAMISASPEARARMGKSAREYVLQNHDHDYLAARFEECLESVIAETRA